MISLDERAHAAYITGMSQKRLRPPVNVTLSLEARSMLSKLAEARGLSRSATVETLIRNAARMKLRVEPFR